MSARFSMENKCSYAAHKDKYIKQPWYHCKTCGLMGNLGCCQVCYENCHKGHDTVFAGEITCFCDCGHGDGKQACKCLYPVSIPHCTHDTNGTKYIKQPWYHCYTCSLTPSANRGCCKNCAEFCHRGHDVRYFGEIDAYCDCGVFYQAKSCCMLSEKDPQCTRKFWGKNFISQPFYHCRTCRLEDNEGCCQACIEFCHRGHDIYQDYRENVVCFCDCGLGKCDCIVDLDVDYLAP